jgi:hypothetical protein
VQLNENHQKNLTNEKPWWWDLIHQQAFDNVKDAITKEVDQAYPDFSMLLRSKWMPPQRSWER